MMKAPGPVAASGLGLDTALAFTFMPEKLQSRVGCGCHNSLARMWAATLRRRKQAIRSCGTGRGEQSAWNTEASRARGQMHARGVGRLGSHPRCLSPLASLLEAARAGRGWAGRK